MCCMGIQFKCPLSSPLSYDPHLLCSITGHHSQGKTTRQVNKRSQNNYWRPWLGHHWLHRRNKSGKTWRHLNQYFAVWTHGFHDTVFFFRCYHPKVEIFYRIITFIRLVLIVKHSYFRPRKQNSWYHTLKNNATRLTALAMVLAHQLLASPLQIELNSFSATRGKRTKFSSTNCVLVTRI